MCLYRGCEGTEKTVTNFGHHFGHQGAPLCFAVHCHCLVSSPDPPHAHILCLCAFFLSIVNVFIVFTLHAVHNRTSLFPRTSPQHKTYGGGNIQEMKFLYMCLISFLE